MITLPALRHFLPVCLALCVGSAPAQPLADQRIRIQPLRDGEGRVSFNAQTGTATGTNGVMVLYGNAVLTADSVTLYYATLEVIAAGRVRIQQDDQLWAGDQIRYNFKTRQIHTDQFRSGKYPFFAAGQGLAAQLTNSIYTATNAYFTTDDMAEPFERVVAKSLTIVPGQYFEARHAVVYLGRVPVFYFPYMKRLLNEGANHWSFTPGYRNKFGPFLLSTYQFTINEAVDGAIHADYRVERGFGGGPDLNLHLGRWGETTLKYYYLYDEDPGEDAGTYDIPANRQMVDLGYQAMPFTNLMAKARLRYLSDELIQRDFFEDLHRANPQPSTFLDLNQLWANFSLDLYTQVRVNDFLETVERLPEIKLTGFRQQIGRSPFFYESESSAGFYRRLFAQTNGLATGTDFEAARADTYHQIILPWTFFDWLNVAPRVGGRYTYYSEAHGAGAATREESRGVFNTGAEATFKVSRVWAGLTNALLEMDGLRHIFEPAVNYVYVPEPNVRPTQLPQFDYELASLRQLPIDFPDYNAIDSVDARNVMRLGMRHRLQTKRAGQLADLVRWEVFSDLRLDPAPGQLAFGDISSDLLFQPRSWLALESIVQYDTDNERLRLALHEISFQPNDRWSWRVGHWYVHDDFSGPPTELGEGSDLLRSTLFYRLNENWGVRASHYYDLREGRMQEQFYSLYRDLRSWTAALTFRLRDPLQGENDVALALTVSLKALPRYGIGDDAVQPYQLLGR
jgi:lipopolysaccharide assembly outer membrane protein LptD (OstA)